MPEYDNNMTGIISKNDRKEKETHADVRGSCEIEGTEYWIDGWWHDRKDGSGRFISLRFKAKNAVASAPQQSQFTSNEDPFA